MSELQRQWDRAAIIALVADRDFYWIATRTRAGMNDVYYLE